MFLIISEIYLFLFRTHVKYSFDTQKQHYSLSRIKGTKQENGRPVNFLQDTYGKCCTDDR